MVHEPPHVSIREWALRCAGNEVSTEQPSVKRGLEKVNHLLFRSAVEMRAQLVDESNEMSSRTAFDVQINAKIVMIITQALATRNGKHTRPEQHYRKDV